MYNNENALAFNRRGRGLSRVSSFAALALAIAVGASWVVFPLSRPAVADSVMPSQELSKSSSSFQWLSDSSPQQSVYLLPLSQTEPPSLSLSPQLVSASQSPSPSDSASPSPSPSLSSDQSDPLIVSSPEILDFLRLGFGTVIFLLAALLARQFGPEWRP